MSRPRNLFAALASSVGVISIVMLAGCSIVAKGHGQYDAGVKERGGASWYGEEFHGRLTASGEVYDQHKLTAAHRSLPLGSRVRVMNASNGRQVEVVINDRGPFVDGRIIDLSHAAAEELDMINSGTSPVVVEVLEEESPVSSHNVSGSWQKEGRGLGRSDSAVETFALEWGSRYGDVWLVPAGGSQSVMAWPPFLDLRDERRSRRLTQLLEDLPPPAPLPEYPPLDDDYEWLSSESDGNFV